MSPPTSTSPPAGSDAVLAPELLGRTGLISRPGVDADGFTQPSTSLSTAPATAETTMTTQSGHVPSRKSQVTSVPVRFWTMNTTKAMAINAAETTVARPEDSFSSVTCGSPAMTLWYTTLPQPDRRL